MWAKWAWEGIRLFITEHTAVNGSCKNATGDSYVRCLLLYCPSLLYFSWSLRMILAQGPVTNDHFSPKVILHNSPLLLSVFNYVMIMFTLRSNQSHSENENSFRIKTNYLDLWNVSLKQSRIQLSWVNILLKYVLTECNMNLLWNWDYPFTPHFKSYSYDPQSSSATCRTYAVL